MTKKEIEQRRKRKLKELEKYMIKDDKDLKEKIDLLFEVAQLVGPYLAAEEERRKKLYSNCEN